MRALSILVLTAIIAPTFGPVLAGAQGLPDLLIDGDRLASSVDVVTRKFKANACPVLEGCAAPGRRKLLRFDVATPNLGDADLVLGSPADNPELFEYSGCHGHYHFSGYASYALYDSNGTAVVRARKQAFCLRDSVQYVPGYPSHGYTCSNQGLSLGWADVYTKYLDCQWLDVTGVPAGTYTLEVIVNPLAELPEGNYDNNVVRVPVTIPRR